MKNLSIFSLALVSLIAGYTIEAKAQCAAQPSCSSLGYSYTGSTSDCVNTPMKCPFNTSYFNCTKKADMFKNMSLNWTGKITIKPKTYYYPSKYGYVFATGIDTGNGAVHLKINGIIFQGSGHSQGMQFYAVPVQPGDSVYASFFSRSEDRIYFVPFRGN